MPSDHTDAPASGNVAVNIVCRVCGGSWRLRQEHAKALEEIERLLADRAALLAEVRAWRLAEAREDWTGVSAARAATDARLGGEVER